MSKQCTVFLHCPYYMFDGCSYPKLWDGRKKMKLCWRNLNCCRHFDFYLHIDSRSSSAMTYGTHFRITLMEVWKIVSHLLSQISFHCTTYIHYKFHIMDSCCLRHKLNFAATSIADFISDVTDFILTYRVTPMADFILLMTLVSCHRTGYFHHKKLYHRFHFITLRTVIKDIISAHFIYSCWLDHTSFSGHFHCRFHFVCYIIHRLDFTCLKIPRKLLLLIQLRLLAASVANIILLASKVSFIADTSISDFISFVTDYISVIPSITDLFQLLPSSRNTFHSLLELYLFHVGCYLHCRFHWATVVIFSSNII